MNDVDELKEILKILAKECLGIISTATLKDGEIELWLRSAISDLERLDIAVTDNLEDDLIKSAIILYVKANFGSTDIKEKENCQKAYDLHRSELMLSDKYRVVDSDV
jgi:hypothetical protein